MRIGIMDRGIPTEQTLEKMRTASPRIEYLVGTARGKSTKPERQFAERPRGSWRSSHTHGDEPVEGTVTVWRIRTDPNVCGRCSHITGFGSLCVKVAVDEDSYR